MQATAGPLKINGSDPATCVAREDESDPLLQVVGWVSLVCLDFVRAFVVIFATIFFVGLHSAFGADPNAEPIDEEFLRGYMSGQYDLVGRKPDSTATYTGHVTLRDERGVLQVTRTIEGKTEKCIARFDTVAGADRIAVLRMHFRFDGKEYDATYRWQSDPDNYPRFTGYVYLAGTKSPGLEALFPIRQ